MWKTQSVEDNQREWFSKKRIKTHLADEVANNAAIIQRHAGAVGVEDARDTHV